MIDYDLIISKLVKKFKTRNPFEIAEFLNIALFFEPLGCINGYYNTVLRQKQIHINCELSYNKQLFTCAHELGHALLHPKANTPFLKGNTLFSVNKMEIQANTFATYLLISNSDLLENSNLTITQLSCLYGIEEKILQLRFNK